MSAAAVDVRGFGFRPPQRDRWALRDLTLQVEPGEHVLLLGASGAGKSTLLRGLAGLLPPAGEQEGEILVDGVPAPAARERVGLLLQDPDAALVLSRAGEDVAFGPQNRGRPAAEVTRRVSAALDAVGFPYPADRAVDALSGGERQRLALAGVLALGPGLLLLDEPTSMLDPEGGALVRAAVSRVARAGGATLVVVEHRVADWLPVVDRVVVLSPTGVVADGSPDDVARAPAAAGTWLAAPAEPALPPASPGPELLVAEHVGYRHRDAVAPALADVGCAVRTGSVLAVTGRNGSGKTSLARLLGGLATPSSGMVTATAALRGPQLREPRPHRWRAGALAGRIGSVFQNPEHAFLTGTVRDEVAVGPLALGRPAADVAHEVDVLLERLRLTELAAANPYTLSGGEQRRLSVGAALATGPSVLVLDEPTFGQDPATWHELVALVAELRAGGSGFVVATHDVAFQDVVADRRLALVAGHAEAAP